MSRRGTVCLACALAAAAAVAAQTLDQRMLDASVTIAVTPGGARDAAGFLLDARHVATNLSACCSRGAPQVSRGQQSAAGKLIWSSRDSDLAILELDRPVSADPVTLAPAKFWRQGQAIYTLQFSTSDAPALVSGQIEALNSSKPGAPRLYQTTAAMLEGNAGGPLFDACGNIAGVNLISRDSKQYASTVDSLIAGMMSAGIPARLAVQSCTARAAGLGAGWIGNAAWIVGILAASGLGFIVTYVAIRKRPAHAGHSSAAVGASAAHYAAPKPFLKAIAGQYMGGVFSLETGATTLGRDPQAANLVFGAESDSISKRHCTVGWDVARQMFAIEDHGSTNGTYLSTGERLAPHVRRDLRPGDRFYIGDLRNQFEVVLEV